MYILALYLSMHSPQTTPEEDAGAEDEELDEDGEDYDDEGDNFFDDEAGGDFDGSEAGSAACK